MAGIKPHVEINGFIIRELRKREGLSVEEIAERAKVTRAYIAKIELGHSERVSPKVFNALLAAFAIDDRRVLLANPHGTAVALEAVSG